MKVLRRDQGYATVVSVGIILAVVSLLFVVLLAASRVAARHEAQQAADLAAVAAAWELALGRPACEKAERVAVLNDATVRECTQEGRDVVVMTAVRGSVASARAGPV
ncbi:Rv3654c family TadE-like protein [Corynebacterium flavescens]|uniref:Rv3654c family TadE-like protein n=1 Tax=Corynebacterium flavescens TaxID=28028 RepID=UPI003FD6A681